MMIFMCRGGHPPSYIYRLLSENYDPDDTRLASNACDATFAQPPIIEEDIAGV